VSLFSFFFFDVRDLAPFVSKDVTSTARRRVVDAALFSRARVVRAMYTIQHT